MAESIRGTQTEKNLLTAFAGESGYHTEDGRVQVLPDNQHHAGQRRGDPLDAAPYGEGDGEHDS